ncbi:MAG: hypothetical protein M1817_001495 [Caeruleum heppii]|nr:MAG: hypothetical protein M1817_001495 [Caeruleum heppii]
MAPTTTSALPLLSPAELSYLHTSLSLSPPIRSDGRLPTQFRPLSAEADILPGTNGSARVCFADGTEAIVGVKAEVEKSRLRGGSGDGLDGGEDEDEKDKRSGENSWVELSIEIPGLRDDDALSVFLAAMLNEALVADGELARRLWINSRWHWRVFVDILLLSPPLSYPLPLLSLTTHLALLSTRLPRLKSELDEDPLFDDDWEASEYLYLRTAEHIRPSTSSHKASSKVTPSSPLQFHHRSSKPPITLLVMSVGSNILFDPTREELAVAEAVFAVSVAENPSSSPAPDSAASRTLRLLSIRTIDPPSRLTSSGVPNSLNTATGGTAPSSAAQAVTLREMSRSKKEGQGVWMPPRGGVKRALVGRIVELVLKRGGVVEDVLQGLEAVDVG